MINIHNLRTEDKTKIHNFLKYILETYPKLVLEELKRYYPRWKLLQKTVARSFQEGYKKIVIYDRNRYQYKVKESIAMPDVIWFLRRKDNDKMKWIVAHEITLMPPDSIYVPRKLEQIKRYLEAYHWVWVWVPYEIKWKEILRNEFEEFRPIGEQRGRVLSIYILLKYAKKSLFELSNLLSDLK